MSNRLLGLFGLLGAPFLAINTYLHLPQSGQMLYVSDSLSGVFDFLYVSGWLCSMIGLSRLKAAGNDRFGRIITTAMLVSLTFANCWNSYEIFFPNHDTLLYNLLNIFWPISNLLMIVYGIAVLRSKTLIGWKRYVPLWCGLWLSITIITSFLVTDIAFWISQLHTAIAWTLLAVVVLTSNVHGKTHTDEQQDDTAMDGVLAVYLHPFPRTLVGIKPFGIRNKIGVKGEVGQRSAVANDD